jgi:hypothetical protein
MELSRYPVSEPAEVIANLRVEPDDRSRSVTIEWRTEDGVGGSHLIPLDGEKSALRYVYPISHLTEGDYLVSAFLQRSDGTSVLQQRRIRVIGKGDSLASYGYGGGDVLVW